MAVELLTRWKNDILINIDIIIKCLNYGERFISDGKKIQCRYYKGELTFSEVDLEEAKETQNAGSVKVTEAAEKVQHNSLKSSLLLQWSLNLIETSIYF